MVGTLFATLWFVIQFRIGDGMEWNGGLMI